MSDDTGRVLTPGGYTRAPMSGDCIGGIALRDWFAGVAMQHLISYYPQNFRYAAEEAYRMADEMLVERVTPRAPVVREHRVVRG